MNSLRLYIGIDGRTSLAGDETGCDHARLFFVSPKTLFVDGFGTVATAEMQVHETQSFEPLVVDCYVEKAPLNESQSGHIPGLARSGMSDDPDVYNNSWNQLARFLDRLEELNVSIQGDDDDTFHTVEDQKKFEKALQVMKVGLRGMRLDVGAGGVKGGQVKIETPSWKIIAVPEEPGNVEFDPLGSVDDVLYYVKEKKNTPEMKKWFSGINWNRIIQFPTAEDFFEDEEAVREMNRSQRKEYTTALAARRRFLPKSEQEILSAGYQWAFHAAVNCETVSRNGVVVFGLGQGAHLKRQLSNRSLGLTNPVVLSWNKQVEAKDIPSLDLPDFNVRPAEIADMPLPFLAWALLVTSKTIIPESRDGIRLRAGLKDAMWQRWILSKKPAGMKGADKYLYIAQYVEADSNAYNERKLRDEVEAQLKEKKSAHELPIKLPTAKSKPREYIRAMNEVDWERAVAMYAEAYGVHVKELKPKRDSLVFILFTPNPVEIDLGDYTTSPEDAVVSAVNIDNASWPTVSRFFLFAANTADPEFDPKDYLKVLVIDPNSYRWDHNVESHLRLAISSCKAKIAEQAAKSNKFE